MFVCHSPAVSVDMTIVGRNAVDPFLSAQIHRDVHLGPVYLHCGWCLTCSVASCPVQRDGLTDVCLVLESGAGTSWDVGYLEQL